MIKLTDLADELLDIIIDHCPLDSLATCPVSYTHLTLPTILLV